MPRKQKRTARSKNGAQHTRTGKTACILQENADIVALVAGQLFSYDELALLAAVCKSLRAFVWDATRFRKSHLHYTAFMPLEPQRMPHALLVRDDTEKDFRVGVAWDTRTYAEMRAGLGMVASRLHNAQKVMVSVVGPHATVMQAKERSVLFLGTAQLVLDMSLFPEMSGGLCSPTPAAHARACHMVTFFGFSCIRMRSGFALDGLGSCYQRRGSCRRHQKASGEAALRRHMDETLPKRCSSGRERL